MLCTTLAEQTDEILCELLDTPHDSVQTTTVSNGFSGSYDAERSGSFIQVFSESGRKPGAHL